MSRHAEKFLPVPDPGTMPFWEGCKRHELLIQECESCGKRQFYPRRLCSACAGTALRWLRTSGRGTVVSWTVVRHPVSPAYADDVPYVIALIELDEGPVMMSSVVDCEIERMASGMPVEVCFEDWTDEITMPKFRPLSPR